MPGGIELYIYISVVNGLMGLSPSGDHGGRDLASLARGLMALVPSGDCIQWVGRNSRKGLKNMFGCFCSICRVKNSDFCTIFRVKKSKTENENRNKSPQAFNGSQVARRGRKGLKRPFWLFLHHI